jgi:hypothetical protein
MSKNIHVIGPYNTGTNLLFNIINNSECIDLIQNKSISIEHQHRPFGKHTLDIKIIENYLNNPDNLLIIMYKNVNNWLYSIKKAHYDIKYTKLYFPVELDNKKFPNMIELYNFYYINYMSLLEKYPNAIFLDYKMVINKSKSYDYINNKLSKINLFINLKNKFNETLMTPAKNHGTSVKNVIEAKESYSGIQDMVKKFLLKKPKFKRSIKPVLIDYYEK